MRAHSKSLLAICAGLMATAASADEVSQSFAELGAKPPSLQWFNFSDDQHDWHSHSAPKLDTQHSGSWEYGVANYGKHDYGWKDYDYCTPIPEPSTYAMMALGLLGIGVYARRRKAD